MKVVVTNKASYSREFQYFRRNQFVVLGPHDSITIDDVHDSVEISYYQSIEANGFLVCFHRDEENNNDCVCDEVKIHHEESNEESEADITVDLSKFSDDELKRIIQNLGVESRARARWKLESIVLENLPRDTSPENYL